MRSIVKWVGGKGRVIDDLKKVFGDVDCFVEPFVGGGSVFLNTDFPKYKLYDSNIDLVTMLATAAEKPAQLVEACERLWAIGSTRSNYMDIRDKFNNFDDEYLLNRIERSAWFIYLNRHGFNGLCRYNKSYKFNVPYGKHATLPYLPKAEIFAFSKHCDESEVYIDCCEFEKAIQEAPSGSLIYADPPYIPSSATASFTQYTKSAFNQQQHRLLAKLLKEAHKRGCRVVLSNSDTVLTKDIYYGFRWETVKVGRYLGAKVDARGTVMELIGVLE